MIHDAPSFIRQARGSSLFHRLDGRLHLNARVTLAEQKLPELLEGAATPILSALGGVLSALGAAVTVSVLVVFMLIFGGRLVRAMVAEARAEHVASYQTILGKDLPVDRRLPGRPGAHLHRQRHAHHQLPGHRQSPLLPAARNSVRDVEHGPLRRSGGGGNDHRAHRAHHPGDLARDRGGIYFITYGQVEGNILGPLVFRRTVHVNPLVTTLSILLLGEIAGVVGAVVAVPVVATLQIILREILQNRRDQLKIASPPAPG